MLSPKKSPSKFLTRGSSWFPRWTGCCACTWWPLPSWSVVPIWSEVKKQFNQKLIPIPSMYGIFTYIWLIFMVNVGEYTIHGCYGTYCSPKKEHRMDSTVSYFGFNDLDYIWLILERIYNKSGHIVMSPFIKGPFLIAEFCTVCQILLFTDKRVCTPNSICVNKIHHSLFWW